MQKCKRQKFEIDADISVIFLCCTFALYYIYYTVRIIHICFLNIGWDQIQTVPL